MKMTQTCVDHRLHSQYLRRGKPLAEVAEFAAFRGGEIAMRTGTHVPWSPPQAHEAWGTDETLARSSPGAM